MKKLFFAICFNLCVFSLSYARITPISGYANIKQEIIGNKDEAVKEVNREEFSEFLSERLKVSKKADNEDIDKNISVIESEFERIRKEESEKNFFEKVYENAMQKINNNADEKRRDVLLDDAKLDKSLSQENIVKEIERQNNDWNKNTIPMIPVVLPNSDIPVDVPAIEHIAYMKNNIDILSNGMVKFEEIIVVVANGQKLRSGLTKILPSKTYITKQKSKNIYYSIISVSINDTPIDYKLAKSGDRVLMVPKNEYNLPAGVHTFKFEYLADNVMIDNDDIYQFYWGVGGNGWNLIIDRVQTKLTTPDKDKTIAHSAMVGSYRGFFPNGVVYKEDGLSYNYETKIPLFIGTGMHIVAQIEKKAFSSTTLSQRFIRSFYNYGDIYISLLGLFIIIISSIVSWIYIVNKKSRVKISLNKTSSTIRYVLNAIVDKKAICGFLLDLYKKNIIDIQQAGETILLIKSTDNLKSLLPYERKVLKNIFPSHETTFSITSHNKLPLKRFMLGMEKGLKKDMLKFKFKLNIGYLLLNIAMMCVVWFSISMFKINSFYTFNVLAVSTLFCLLGCLLWHTGNKKWQKFIFRCFSIIITLFCWIICSAVVNFLASLFIIFSTIVIVYSLKLYSGPNGLIRPYIEDIMKQKNYLIKNKDVIILSKSFLKHQAFIFVCDLEEEIQPPKEDEKYKIPVIKNIMLRL